MNTLLATAVGPHLFWLTSRAAGIAALILSSISVSIGLSMGGRFAKRHRMEMRVTHEALSLATLAALAALGLTLLGDGFLRPSLGDIAVPFLSGYKTFWTDAWQAWFLAMAAIVVLPTLSLLVVRHLGAAPSPLTSLSDSLKRSATRATDTAIARKPATGMEQT